MQLASKDTGKDVMVDKNSGINITLFAIA